MNFFDDLFGGFRGIVSLAGMMLLFHGLYGCFTLGPRTVDGRPSYEVSEVDRCSYDAENDLMWGCDVRRYEAGGNVWYVDPD